MLLQMSIIDPNTLATLVRSTSSEHLEQLHQCQTYLSKQLEIQMSSCMSPPSEGLFPSNTVGIQPISPVLSETNAASPPPFVPAMPPPVANYVVRLDKGLDLGHAKKDSFDSSMLSSIVDKVKNLRLSAPSITDDKNTRRPSMDSTASSNASAADTKPSASNSTEVAARDGVKRYTAKPSRAAKRYDKPTVNSMARARSSSFSKLQRESLELLEEATTTTATDASTSGNNNNGDDDDDDAAQKIADPKIEQSERVRLLLMRLRQHVEQMMQARAATRKASLTNVTSADSSEGVKTSPEAASTNKE
ncbi:hypothetical protein BDF19DRAFT_422891 [Syncephalis fuscata]|nr:hypothetical protein BDF19DRAFT_422891 [Syncephalis fuscata]